MTWSGLALLQLVEKVTRGEQMERKAVRLRADGLCFSSCPGHGESGGESGWDETDESGDKFGDDVDRRSTRLILSYTSLR